jgi:hypothetical protein
LLNSVSRGRSRGEVVLLQPPAGGDSQSGRPISSTRGSLSRIPAGIARGIGHEDLRMMNRVPSLTERQLRFIERAAAALPLDRRQDFERSVMMRLTGQPGDFAVSTAVNDIMGMIPRED